MYFSGNEKVCKNAVGEVECRKLKELCTIYLNTEGKQRGRA
jgi:hypothetical protein